MPLESYTFGGIIYDIAGAAITVDSVEIIAINVTQSTSADRITTTAIPNPTDGSYALDFANFEDKDGVATDYDDGDGVQIHFRDSTGSYVAALRHTIDMSAPVPDGAGDAYLHEGQQYLSDVTILGGWASNEDGSNVEYFDIYNITHDTRICRVVVPTSNTVALPLSIVGKKISGGMCIVYEAASQDLSVVMSVK